VLPESVVARSFDAGVYRYSDAKHFFARMDPLFANVEVPEDAPFMYVIDNQEKRVSNSYFCQVLAEAFSCDLIAGFDRFDPIAKSHFNSAFYFKRS
jgi:hypothetical protein